MAGSAVLILVVLLLVVGVGAAFLMMGSGKDSSNSSSISIDKLYDRTFYLCNADGSCEDRSNQRRFTFKEHSVKENGLWRSESPGTSKHLYILRKSSTSEALKFDEFVNNTGDGNPDNSWTVKYNKKGKIVMTDPNGVQLVDDS